MQQHVQLWKLVQLQLPLLSVVAFTEVAFAACALFCMCMHASINKQFLHCMTCQLAAGAVNSNSSGNAAVVAHEHAVVLQEWSQIPGIAAHQFSSSFCQHSKKFTPVQGENRTVHACYSLDGSQKGLSRCDRLLFRCQMQTYVRAVQATTAGHVSAFAALKSGWCRT